MTRQHQQGGSTATRDQSCEATSLAAGQRGFRNFFLPSSGTGRPCLRKLLHPLPWHRLWPVTTGGTHSSIKHHTDQSSTANALTIKLPLQPQPTKIWRYYKWICLHNLLFRFFSFRACKHKPFCVLIPYCRNFLQLLNYSLELEDLLWPLEGFLRIRSCHMCTETILFLSNLNAFYFFFFPDYPS